MNDKIGVPEIDKDEVLKTLGVMTLIKIMLKIIF